MKKLNVLLLALGVIASAQLGAQVDTVIITPAASPDAPIVLQLSGKGYQEAEMITREGVATPLPEPVPELAPPFKDVGDPSDPSDPSDPK